MEKGKPEDLVYTIDYHLLEEGERQEYVEMFELGGWEYVCSQYNMHIFKAPAGTKPIYSDNETKKEKYIRMSMWWGNTSLILFILFIVSLLFRWQVTGIAKRVADVGYGITLILFVPSIITYIALFIRKMKLKKGGRKG